MCAMACLVTVQNGLCDIWNMLPRVGFSRKIYLRNTLAILPWQFQLSSTYVVLFEMREYCKEPLQKYYDLIGHFW